MKTANITVGALCAFTLGFSAIAPAAHAQVTYRGMSKDQIKELVSDTERQSNAVRKIFEDRLNEGLLAKTEKQGVTKKRVQMLDTRLERLARDLDRTKDPSTIRLGVKETIELAGPVQSTLNRNAAARRTIGSSWLDLKADLNKLARLYNVPRVGRL